MRNLHPRHHPLLFNKCGNLRQFLDLFILPDAKITGRDPSPRFDRRGFREH
jgi:hypothetical protein